MSHQENIKSPNERAPEKESVHLKAFSFYKKQDENFKFLKEFKTFDFVTKNTAIAIDGKDTLTAKKDCYILFPNKNTPVGSEVFILAEELQ